MFLSIWWKILEYIQKFEYIQNVLYWTNTFILSNSTPTCKPNSTSVGSRRSWLCFPMEEEGKRRNAPSCLIFGDFLVGVWRVSMGCLNGNLVSQDWWCQDRSSHYRSSQDMPSPDGSSQERSSQDRSSQDKSSQDWSSQDRSSQDRSSQDRSS